MNKGRLAIGCDHAGFEYKGGSKGVRCALVTGRTGPITAVLGTIDSRDVTVRDADGAITVLSVGAFALTARDAPSGKIRNFAGVITGFETV